MKAKDLIDQAVTVARELGHNIQVVRDTEGHFIPLFRYRAIGQCVTCGAQVVVDTSPAQMGCSWPFNEDKANVWPQISGQAFDTHCIGRKPKGKPVSAAPAPREKRRKNYYLRRAMSR
jgi:hypothetical protein